MKKVMIGLTLVLVAGCHRAVPPEILRQYQSRTLYTCCNIHYEREEISDANYYVGSMIPLGTPVQVSAMTADSVTFSADGVRLTLWHSYGTEQESSRQYFDKTLVPSDPKLVVQGYPELVQNTIRDGRVEAGMTREQVVLSLGHPPTHQTPSESDNVWTYWYNRWVTYQVIFDDAGVVTSVAGRPAPTREEPVS